MLMPLQTMHHSRKAEDVLKVRCADKEVVNWLSSFRLFGEDLVGGSIGGHCGGCNVGECDLHED